MSTRMWVRTGPLPPAPLLYYQPTLAGQHRRMSGADVSLVQPGSGPKSCCELAVPGRFAGRGRVVTDSSIWTGGRHTPAAGGRGVRWHPAGCWMDEG